MTHGSFFTGIGGFDLAAEWMGWKNVFHCEYAPYQSQLLRQNFPNSIAYNDITKTQFKQHNRKIDIVTGGFPCQPHSVAGKQNGTNDARWLWPSMLKAIEEIEPTYILGENVAGIINQNDGSLFERICTDLENKGYKVQPYIIPANSIGGFHNRKRVWIMAYSGVQPNIQTNKKISAERSKGNAWDHAGRSHWNEIPSFDRSVHTPRVLRDLNGISYGMDRNKSLGNAIVPQIAYQLFSAIQAFDSLIKK